MAKVGPATSQMWTDGSRQDEEAVQLAGQTLISSREHLQQIRTRVFILRPTHNAMTAWQIKPKLV